MNRILVINPGSTSTKIAIFEEDRKVFEDSITHSAESLASYPTIYDQFDFRLALLKETLREQGIPIKSIDCVVGRGGLMKPIVSGTYRVNDAMLEDFRQAKYGEHASNLGALLADAIAGDRTEAFIVDPVVVDEMDEIARVSGYKGIERISIFHALNQKAIGKRHAKESGRKYEEMNLIIAHLGGGISVGAHEKGRVVDVNNALNGDGPFSPERSGGLPMRDVITTCFHSGLSEAVIRKSFVGEGGLVSYFHTADARDVRAMIEKGDSEAALVYDAMAYQVSKEIAGCAAVLKGKIDAILLTGGIAYDSTFTEKIKERVGWMAKVEVYPGEDELEALALGALCVKNGEEQAREYA